MPRRGSFTLSTPGAVGLACVCALVGVLSLYNSALWLLGVWRTDDLKSVGIVVPVVSFALILRAWRGIGWRFGGTWWGFAVLLVTALVVFLRDQTMLVLTVHKGWLVQLPPVSLLAILYALGMVLLFGGVPLLRAAWFPVLLMGAVLPVPETFSRVVDLPLQHASATVARGFAHLLGEPLTPDNLRLMFTPDFGMFIAPGCNGIRGAVTLGMAAVIIAYVYRFRWFVFAPVVAGAVLLGYLFNLLRLCLLVVYYKIALPYPWLQDRAKGADYLIGGCLFVLALYLFFALADRLRQKPNEVLPAPAPVPAAAVQPALPLLLKAAAVAILALVFGLDDLHAQHEAGAQQAQIPDMPTELGGYKLVRTYQDTLTTGVVVYQWGDYQAPGGGETVSVGVSPELDMHDVEVCHIARGEDPVWHGRLTAETPAGEAHFVAATYNNGLVQTLEASTLCDAGGCRQYTNATGDMTFVYAHPRRVLPMGADAGRPLPMLLKVTSADVAARPEVAEAAMASALQSFLRGADLRDLRARFRK
ncbi:MAG TPA: exosortase J [Acidobacteriaceae bacterium]|nr:exosortase J [Acidobacteriaceae bacterium]